MLKKILVALDGSENAEKSLPWGIRLARLLKSKIVFLHVYPAGPAGLRGQHRENLDALNKRMMRVCGKLQEQGRRAAFNVQRGDAADRILAFADRNDLILATTHGFGGFMRWVFGSVAEKLIHDAPIPVLVYKTAGQA